MLLHEYYVVSIAMSNIKKPQASDGRHLGLIYLNYYGRTMPPLDIFLLVARFGC